MDAAYTSMAEYLNCAEVDLSFGPSTSMNTYVLAQAFRQTLRTGDEVIVTNQDHEANQGSWRRLEDVGVKVNEWKVNPESGCLHISDLEQLLTEKTKLVAFTHCSNVVGHVNNVKGVTDLVRSSCDALVVVDGVSYAGHGIPDVKDLGSPDVYMFSTYKVGRTQVGLFK